jgi:hypothetical protein
MLYEGKRGFMFICNCNMIIIIFFFARAHADHLALDRKAHEGEKVLKEDQVHLDLQALVFLVPRDLQVLQAKAGTSPSTAEASEALRDHQALLGPQARLQGWASLSVE